MAKTLTNKTLLDRRMKGLTFDGQPKTPPAAPVGMVEGLGTGTSDSNLIAASAGEYVLPAETTEQIGPEELDQLVRETTGQEPGGKPVERGLMGFSGGGRIHPSIPERPGPRPSVAAAAPVGTGLVRGAMNLLGGRRAQLEAAENKALGAENRGLRGYSMGGLIEDEELMGFNKGGFVDDFGNVDQRALGNVRNQPRTTDFGDMSQRTMAERSQQARTVAGSRMAQLNQANMNVPNTPAGRTVPAAAPAAVAKPGLGARVLSKVLSPVNTLGKASTGLGLLTHSGNAGDVNEDAWAAQQQAAIRVPGGNFLPGGDATDSGVAYAPQVRPFAPGGVRAMMAAPSQAAAAQLGPQQQQQQQQQQPTAPEEAPIARTDVPGQSPMFSGQGTQQNPQGLSRISSGGDMNAANESFARANAIRAEMTPIRDQLAFNAGNGLTRRTTAEERAAFVGNDTRGSKQQAPKMFGADSFTGMSRNQFLALGPKQRAAMTAAFNSETAAQGVANRIGDRGDGGGGGGGGGKEKGLSPELQYRMMNDALGRERDDLKEQRKEATRLGERAEDREASAADRDQAQRESNMKEITRMVGGDEEAGNEAYQSIVRNRQALLARIEKSGANPELVAQLRAPMTSDELQQRLAMTRIDKLVAESGGGMTQALGLGIPAAAAAAWKTPGTPLQRLVAGGAAGLGAGALGYAHGEMGGVKGPYEEGNHDALFYDENGQFRPPEIRGNTLMLANGTSLPVSKLDDRTLHILGIDRSPFSKRDTGVSQDLRTLGTNRP
jgi:hypothetical protein